MLNNKEKIIYLLTNKNLNSINVLNNDISIKPNNILNTFNKLKFNSYFLITASAVDQINKFNRFLILYVLCTYNQALHIYISKNTNMMIPSIVNLYSSAIWLEREIYDLFGIFFTNSNNNNDLRRILTDYHFKGHPLRKDFSLIGYDEKIFSFFSKTIHNKHDVIF